MQQVLKWFNSHGLSYPMLNVKGLSWLELSVGFFLWVLFNWFEQYTCSSLLNQSHMLASSQYMSPSKSPDYCLYRFFFCLCFLKSINREYIGNFSCIIVITWWAGQRGDIYSMQLQCFFLIIRILTKTFLLSFRILLFVGIKVYPCIGEFTFSTSRSSEPGLFAFPLHWNVHAIDSTLQSSCRCSGTSGNRNSDQ